MKQFALRSLQSALSIGPGYEPQPPGAFFDCDKPRGYFIDFRAKTRAASATSPARLLPADLAQLALGWWDCALAGDSSAAAGFDAAASQLEQQGRESNGELLWPYAVSVRKYNLEPPWCSALAQGQAASVFVRAHMRSGDERFAVAARKAIAPLLPASSSGLLAVTADGVVPEEAPSHPPSLILNGWIYALWGLWDVATALGDSESREVFENSARCLQRSLARYDVGWWSRYSLYPHRLPDLAKPFYHRLHVDQLDVLYRLLGYREFLETTRRWAAYDTVPRRIAVLAQKALFVSRI
jgi:heparosan-N-sulfate-glucuronate 5-epimerase